MAMAAMTMRTWLVLLLLLFSLVSCSFWLAAAASTTTSTCQREKKQPQAPYVTPQTWLPSSTDYSEQKNRRWQEVRACCRQVPTDAVSDDDETCVTAANGDDDALPLFQTVVIGQMPQFSTDDALQVLQQAVQAWNGGSGVWPQMTLQQRCDAIETFLRLFLEKRDEMVTTLMWEIGKNRNDAEAEIDRTVDFAQQLIATIQSDAEYKGEWQTVGSTKAMVRRSAIGVIMCLAPYNYPINESYAAIIPALLTGNIILLKIPTTGGLAHLLTMEAFSKALPPGTVNFIAGSGRATMPPLMETGLIDGLAFIGGSSAADKLIHSHPHPHRLKVFLQLEANNMGILLPDIFETNHDAVLQNALDEAVLGSLSFNGQRCTALKLFLVPNRHGEAFAQQLARRIEALPIGLPWQSHHVDDGAGGTEQVFSKITPLPNQQRIAYLKSLVDDALDKGARIINKNGGSVIGGDESTLMVPAVLYPVTSEMKVYHEEQFGPIVPVAPFDDLETVLRFGQEGPYAQQVSIFTQDAKASAVVLDRFSAVFGKINLNSQCGRSPDTLPFSGRRSSAMGVMSVRDALREFSVPTVIAYKVNNNNKNGVDNERLAQGLYKESLFLQPLSSSSSGDILGK